MTYAFLKGLGLPEDELAKRTCNADALDYRIEGLEALVILDDNVTSGTQLKRFFAEMQPSFTGAREHFAQPLSQRSFDALQKLKIYVLVAVGLGPGASAVEQDARKLGLNVEVFVGKEDLNRWFEYGSSRIWSTQKDADEFRQILKDYSRELLQPKGWPDEKLRERLLGYGNSEKLTVFAHNVPKSLPAPFWKLGTVNGTPWIPLFPEASEWAKHRKLISTGVPERRAIARMVATGAFHKGAPSLDAGLLIAEGHTTSTTEIEITANTHARELYNELIRTAHRVELLTTSSGAEFPTVVAQIGEPSQTEVDDYNNKAREYNNNLDSMRTACFDSVCLASRLVALPIRIRNDGNATASDVTLKIELPPEIEFVADFPDLPTIPPPPKKPEWSPINSRFALANSARDLINAIRDRPIMDDRAITFVQDRGRSFVRIQFGKIIQGDFVDEELCYLALSRGRTVTLTYHIICDESAYPTGGTFVLTPTEGSPSEELQSWFQQLNIDKR